VTDRIAAALAADGLALPADFTALITRSGLHRDGAPRWPAPTTA